MMPSIDVLILRELLAADQDFVSGNRLAEIAHVSRVSIWSHLEKLRTQGFEFEAVKGQGYRLAARPDSLNTTLLQALLVRAAEPLRATVLDDIDSTNSEAERLLANGEPTPFLVIARRQSGGRGRMGRVWHSPPAGNLYASFAFRPMISPARMGLFTLWMGVNICECLNALGRIRCSVKWPNDIHVGGKKVAGILTEARMETDLVRDVVLGLGINVNSEEDAWPEELRPVATSLRQAAGQLFDLNRLAAAVAGRVMIAYQQFLDGHHRTALRERWLEHDLLHQRPVSLMQGSNRISGIAHGIDSTGALIIERTDGSRFLARAGEVSLEKNVS